jgi:hypothetical protein
MRLTRYRSEGPCLSSQDVRSLGARTPLRHHLPFICLVVCLALISYPAWIHVGVPGTDDLSNLNVPQRQFLASSYRLGQWPLWNPDSFAGQPFLAAGQSGPLYLPNIFYVLLPVVVALKASYIFHLTLAAVGAYLSSWHFSRSRLGAVVGAITFVDCGFLVGHQIHTQMFDAVCWLPLIIFLFARTFERPSRRRMALSALALGGEIYAGHPQMTFYLCLFLVLYLLFMFIWLPSRESLRRLAMCGVPLVGGFLVAAAQVLPTLQLVSYSDRSAAGSDFLLAGSMNPLGLAQFLMQSLTYTGQPLTIASIAQTFWEFTCYAGLTGLILAAAVIFFGLKHNLYVRTFGVIAGIALLFCLGLNTRADVILVRVPGFDLFRIPARFVCLVDYTIAMLAAIGIASLQSGDTSRRLRLAVISAASIAIPLIVAIHVFSHASLAPAAAYLVPLMLCLLVILLCLIEATWLTRRLPAIFACLAVAEVTSYAMTTANFVNWQSGSYVKPGGITRYLMNHQASGLWPRIASFGDTTLMLDRNLSFGLPSVNGYDSVVPMWYASNIDLTREEETFLSQPRSLADALSVRYVVISDSMNLPFPRQTEGIQSWHVTLPDLHQGTGMLRINLNLRHSGFTESGAIFSVTLTSGHHVMTRLVSGWPASAYLVPIPKNWPHYQSTEIEIQNEAWNGWYRVTDVQVQGDGEPQTTLVNQTFAPKAWTKVKAGTGEAVWENPDTISRAWLADNEQAPLVHASGKVVCTKDGTSRQTWHVTAGHPEWLVLSQMYDPNWHATVDGKQLPVKRVDGVLTAVKVDSGSHTIDLTYDPMSFHAGLAVSILTSLVCFLLTF